MKSLTILKNPFLWVSGFGTGILGYAAFQDQTTGFVCGAAVTILFFVFQMIGEERRKKADEKRLGLHTQTIATHIDSKVVARLEAIEQKLSPPISEEIIIAGMRKSLKQAGDASEMQATEAQKALESGRYSDAESLYFALTTGYADVPELWFNLGYARTLLGKHSEAITAYDAG